MKIKELSHVEKQNCIDNLIECFDDIRGFLNKLQEDMDSKDLAIQGTAVLVSDYFCEGYSAFVKNIKDMDKKKETLENLKSEIIERDLEKRETVLI